MKRALFERGILTHWKCGAVLVAALAAAATTVASAETPALQSIRSSDDGAGPSHLFWLAGPSPSLTDRDVIGIIDPLLAAVRLYSVRRAAPNGDALDKRLEAIGACSLPIAFRPWRILQMKDEVRIEAMPKPGKDGQNSNRGDFTSDVYVLKRDLVRPENSSKLKKAVDTIRTTKWDPNSADVVPCGMLKDTNAPVGKSAPFSASRGVNRPKRTIIWRTDPAALAGGGRLIVRAGTKKRFYLFSVKELEPTSLARVVLITEGVPTSDGMIRLNQRLLLFGKDGSKPLSEIGFDDTHFRSKIGQKPLAVMPTGEVLAMGRDLVRPDANSKFEMNFRIQSCGFIGSGNVATGLCSNADDVVKNRQDADSAPAPTAREPVQGSDSSTTPKQVETARSIFKRATKLANFSWTVDASALDDDCRRTDGCPVMGQVVRFVPLKGIRLMRQGTYTQVGLPYAQTETFKDYDRFYEAFSGGRFAGALHNVKARQADLPGNLADLFTGDLGIDCSAFLQVAWNGREKGSDERTSTKALQNGSVSFRCPNRLPDPSYLKSGDAIGIHLEPGADHVVLYAANIAFDGASEFWLVLESTSSCDGVCWSVYDPSFFNGWGLYRAANRADKRCLPSRPETSIERARFPAKFDGWRESVVRGLR
jgi:hypothetical protein